MGRLTGLAQQANRREKTNSAELCFVFLLLFKKLFYENIKYSFFDYVSLPTSALLSLYLRELILFL